MPEHHSILADENFSRQSVDLLQSFGHNLISLDSIGLSQIGLPDEKVLKKATELNRCVLTFNRLDFIKLHKANSQHAGIIVCTYNQDHKELAEKIHRAIQDLKSLHGLLIRVYRG